MNEILSFIGILLMLPFVILFLFVLIVFCISSVAEIVNHCIGEYKDYSRMDKLALILIVMAGLGAILVLISPFIGVS